MNQSLLFIKAVGFDLDRTLYMDTPEMRGVVLHTKLAKILKLKPELETIENVQLIYQKKCKKTDTWSEVFKIFAAPYSAELVQTCLASAGIIDFINKDTKLTSIINQLSQKYFLQFHF